MGVEGFSVPWSETGLLLVISGPGRVLDNRHAPAAFICYANVLTPHYADP